MRRALVGLALLAGLLALLALGAGARASDLPRVISLNLCVDQLVLELAEPAQIMGLSPYARDAVRSQSAKAARNFPVLSGSAEEVLTLKPDVVLTGPYARSTTRAFLSARGIAQEAFDAANTVEETRAQLLRMGAVLRQEARAQARVATLDAAAERLRGSARGAVSVLVLERRGFISGRASLPGALLALAGATNAGEALTQGFGGFAGLEAVLAARPDALLLVHESGVAEDQGSALLHHPALDALFPPERRLHLPERLTVCGGPGLAEAMDRLAEGLRRIAPR